MMGLFLSQYVVIQYLLWESEVVRGDNRDLGNPFIWENFRLNIPGYLDY